MSLRGEKQRSIFHRVGLDIGSHAVKGVEVVERLSETIVRSVGSVAMPGINARSSTGNTSATVNAIKTLWGTAAFETNRVVLALPSEAVYTKWLNLEASSEDELDSIARSTAARGAPFSPSDAIIDYRVISSRFTASRKVHFVMLAAASSSAVDELLDVVEKAGLDPVAADIGSVAALRSCSALWETKSSLWGGQPTAHCIIGAKSTTIMVGRDGALELARTVPVGGNDFTQNIADELKIDWAVAEKMKTDMGTWLSEDGTLVALGAGGEIRVSCVSTLNHLSREIKRSLKFFSSQFAEGSYLGLIGTVTLSGGGALLRGVEGCLQKQGVDAKRIINPFLGFAVDSGATGIEQVGDETAAYTTAMGLAIGDYSISGAEPVALCPAA